MAKKKKKTAAKKTILTRANLPVRLHRRLRAASALWDKTIPDVVIEALDKHLPK